MILFTKQKQTPHRQNKLWLPKGKWGAGGNKLGIWD